MKKIILILSIILLAGCNQELEQKSIVLKSTGTIDVKPDEASVLISINCINKNIDISKKCLSKETTGLKSVLLSLGIKEEDILTTQINLEKDYSWINSSNVFNGYNATATTNVIIRDLDIISDFYTKLLTNKVLTINSLTYHHSDYSNFEKKAYLVALENSKSLADKILSQLPENNKEIIQVSNMKITTRNNSLIVSKGVENFRSNATSNVDVSVGNMIIEQTLFVKFKIF